jgi:hypothetical protein
MTKLTEYTRYAEAQAHAGVQTPDQPTTNRFPADHRRHLVEIARRAETHRDEPSVTDRAIVELPSRLAANAHG